MMSKHDDNSSLSQNSCRTLHWAVLIGHLQHHLLQSTRSSADADKPARRVQRLVKVTNIVPFHMLGIVSY